jgi:hypothetical protein
MKEKERDDARDLVCTVCRKKVVDLGRKFGIMRTPLPSRRPERPILTPIFNLQPNAHAFFALPASRTTEQTTTNLSAPDAELRRRSWCPRTDTLASQLESPNC